MNSEAEAFTPFLDMLFLTLMSLLALQIGMVGVQGIKVDLVKVGNGAATTCQDKKPCIISLRSDGRLFVEDKETTFAALGSLPADKALILRADRRVTYEQVIECLSRVKKLHRDVVLEVATEGREEKDHG